jgi:hypothetical protein
MRMSKAPKANKILRFPHRRSAGTLFVAPLSQPEEWELLSQVRGLIVNPDNHPIKWEWLEEARGRVQIPAQSKVKLKIASKGSGGLSALESLAPDDLHTLDLSRSDISDASLVNVKHLSELKVLELTATTISDEGLGHLSELVNLQGLGLSHCQITGKGLLSLRNLRDLRELWLSGADLTDGDLPNLMAFTDVVQLGLSGTKLTDAGINHLAELKKLTRIYLFNTPVTLEGMQKLRQLAPGCRVKWKAHSAESEAERNDSLNYDRMLDGLPEEVAAKLRLPLDIPDFAPDTAYDSMTEERFWTLIQLLDWGRQGDDDAVIEPVIRRLSAFPAREICRFADILAAKLFQLDQEKYAKHIGKDAFSGKDKYFSKSYFLGARCCVIANGKEYFEEVLENPPEMPKDLEFEGLLKIPARAYELKTGKKYAYSAAKSYETFSNREGWKCL